MNIQRGLFIGVCLLLVCFLPLSLYAAEKRKTISLIRDEEIEVLLRDYADPIFKAAGIAPENVDMYIVNDNSLNAYVSGGMKMFVHSGLIAFSEDPLVLIGVMAHETGHIAGGHLVRAAEDYEKVNLQAALSYILGAASIAAGAPQAGQAIISGGTHAALRSAMQFSRLHEEAADQAAIDYLKKLNLSPRGMVTLLEELNEKENLYFDKRDPYALTHPVSKDRISHIKSAMEGGGATKEDAPEDFQKRHARAVAKLKAFTMPPKDALKLYPEENKTVAARYARAIAYFRIPQLEKGIVEIDALLKMYPEDPYFNELKGQMLFEHGKVRASLPYYEKAVALKPDSALMKLELAIAQLATEDEALLASAKGQLQKAVTEEPRNAMAWRQLAIAYGRSGDLGNSYLSLAEEAALLGKKEDVETFADKAEKLLKEGSPGDLRLKDLRRSVDEEKKDKI